MTRAKGKAQLQYREPGEAKGVLNLDEMTMAEIAKRLGVRSGMIYEMFNFSQYADGSVLNCYDTKHGRAAETLGDWMSTYTAQEVADGAVKIVDSDYKPATDIMNDLIRNAKAALKNGTTTNLAPKVMTITRVE